ncbi:Vms1 protein [Saccharomycopsis crataegensis]|uniref:Vms1 protein n=1 Tax=Saccharomycopsis crataegensis TaxID=43959 RepID=A0AAV5QKD8_9ASCO|nr:Vms1 protein [Saccharomycopsis crataegensis]
MSVAYEDLNCNDLYIYNLREEILTGLRPVFFDFEAKMVPKPDGFQWPTLPSRSPSSSAIMDVSSLQESLPKIVYPKPRSTELPILKESINEDEDLSSGSENGDDDEEEEEEEEEEDIYLERPAHTNSQIIAYDDTDTRVDYLNTRSPYMFFNSDITIKNSSGHHHQHDLQKMGIYKSIFDPTEITNPLEALKQWKHQYNDEEISALFMISGGHFVAAIVSHKPRVIKKQISPHEAGQYLSQTVSFIDHKSFHRYTTRRKQGGSQSAMDNAKGKANSAGSSLRRYNEQALANDVREAIKGWAPYLSKCKSIFIKANNVRNFRLIVSGDDITDNTKKNKEFELYKNDPRIKKFPFTTKRPTIQELRHAWVALTYLTPVNLPKIDDRSRLAKQKQQQLQSSKSLSSSSTSSTVTTTSQASPETPEIKHTNELIGLLKKSKAPALIAYLRRNKIDVNSSLEPLVKHHKAPTLLHWAAEQRQSHMIYVLLVTLKADATIKSNSGKTAFDLLASGGDDRCSGDDIKCQRSFQKARFKLGESYCDWDGNSGAHMVNFPGLSEEDIIALEAKELERERKAREQMVAEEKSKLRQESVTRKFGSDGKVLDGGSMAKIDKQIVQSLSEDDRRKLERERRARAAEARFGKK